MRLLAAAGGSLALAVTVSACGMTEQLTAGMRAKKAVAKLGEQPSASVIASVDGTREEVREFLHRARGSEPSPRAVRLLESAEVTFAVGSGDETPLGEMRRSDALNTAAALNFGDLDVFAVKSVNDKLFLRARPVELAEQTEMSRKNRERAREVVALADDLPNSLGSAKDALQRKWIALDPEAFADFARTAGDLAERARRTGNPGSPGNTGAPRSDRGEALRQAAKLVSGFDGQSQRAFVNRLEKLLQEHARFGEGGKRDGAEHVRVTVPGREAAGDLATVLEPLGIGLDPSRVPDQDLRADLEVRRGQLTGVTVDLGRFTGGRGAHLPLRLEIGSGSAVSVSPPNGAKELRPADLMAALMYGALGAADSRP